MRRCSNTSPRPWNTIYSAKDLAADPAAPRTKINGTGPFIFVEHVKGSHVAGKKNPDYFKKNLPYLDGFRGIFTLQAAAMLNAVQGAQVLGEFRGISPAERDRLVSAMGDKIRIEESSWTLNLLVVFNTEKKPFDDVRVRRALLDGDRPLGRKPGPLAHLDAALGRRRDPPGLTDGDARSGTCEAAGLRKGHQEVPRGGAEAARPKPAYRTSSLQLWNRNLAMPYTPAGIFLVDQWRQIGVEVEHVQSDTGKYLATMSRASSTSQSTSQTCSWTIPA